MKKSISGLLAVFCLFLLLLKPSLALEGARQGLLLWADTVLPTLLPFMICSGLIVAFDAVHLLTRPLSPLLKGLLGLSDQGGYVLVCGLLCGYPMGARTASEFTDSLRISPAEGRCLLAVSNHPSPMFVLGYIGSLISQVMPGCPLWLLLLCLYLPILPLSLLARKLYAEKSGSREQAFLPGASSAPFSFSRHMMDCVETMVLIGGYIMLFSILSLYLKSLPFPDSLPLLLPALLGLVEITTGIEAIAASVPGPAGAMLILGSAAFGGICGLFQTKSVIKNAGLSIRHYILWKILHSGLSCILFYVLTR